MFKDLSSMLRICRKPENLWSHSITLKQVSVFRFTLLGLKLALHA